MKIIECDNKKMKQKLKRMIPKTYEILKNYNCFIAGGTITSLFRNSEINDIDVYFTDKQELFKLLMNEFSSDYIIHISKKAITFKLSEIERIQLIFFDYYDTAEKIFNDFDFTINMGAFDFQKDKFILTEDFLQDNIQKKLIINTNTKFPIITATRILKYKQKGYDIDIFEMIKLSFAINILKIKTWEELEIQLGGMYGENIIELTNEEKEKQFDINKVIEKINNYYNEEHEFKRENEEMKKILGIDSDVLKWQILLKYNMEYFVFRNQYYVYIDENNIFNIEAYIINQNKDYFSEIEGKQITSKKIVLYKYVKKVNDRYFSFYDKNYEYLIGNLQKPEKKDWLYLRRYDELKYSTYNDEREKAILKCEVEISDIEDLNLQGDIKVKKLKVLSEMKEEIEEDIF